MRYIIDSRYFDGACFTSMSDDRHSDYGGETLEELREREKNPHLVAVSPGRISLLAKRYTLALSRPFQEITEERYYELFECLPPARMGSGWFFVGEPYYGDLYPFCFRSRGRFFQAERSIRLSNAGISRQIREHMEKADRRPAIVKEASFVKYVSWHKKTVTYIPYHFRYGGKMYFLKNLATRTGSEFDDRRERNEMAALLRNLRGNVCEYSAVFHYRIYSRELFSHIINQLRTVKRYHAWHREKQGE